MYIITKEKVVNAKVEAISKYVYKTYTNRRLSLPEDALVFRRINTKKFRLGKKKRTPSFNLVIFNPQSPIDKRTLKRLLSKSLGLKIAPLHIIFPNIDYDSLSYKKIRRPSEIRRIWGNTMVIASLLPANPSTEAALRETAVKSISTAKDMIKGSCAFPVKLEREKNAKKISNLKIKLRILKTRCLVYSYCFGLNLKGEYMKAYKAFNNYRKACKNLLR